MPGSNQEKQEEISNMEKNNNSTKEQERSELHRAIWQIANDLRGSVDGHIQACLGHNLGYSMPAYMEFASRLGMRHN